MNIVHCSKYKGNAGLTTRAGNERPQAISRLPDGATDEKKTALRGGFLIVQHGVFRIF